MVSHLVGGLIAGILQSQVDRGVLQRAPHVELQGDVVHTLGIEEIGITTWSVYLCLFMFHFMLDWGFIVRC